MTGRPTFLILGGINGAGKSTTAAIYAEQPQFQGVPILNPDRITADIIAANPGIDPRSADFQGLRRFREAMDQHLAARESLIAETVLANLAYRTLCRDAQASGYVVGVVFVCLRSPEESIARVALRVSKGGHNVSETDIRRRWPKVHENLTWFAQHADWVQVYDNSGDGLAPRHIATVRQGTVTIHDAEALPLVTEALRRAMPG